MSEISRIVTTSNKFVYSNISAISDGVNNFLNSYKLVQTTSITRTIKGGTNNSLPISVNGRTDKTLIYHCYGTISKDITDRISMYNFSNGGANTATIIPSDKYSNIDYVNVVWINRAYGTIFIRSYNHLFQPLDVLFTCNFTVDIYELTKV